VVNLDERQGQPYQISNLAADIISRENLSIVKTLKS
jgi:hypothetical protein